MNDRYTPDAGLIYADSFGTKSRDVLEGMRQSAERDADYYYQNNMAEAADRMVDTLEHIRITLLQVSAWESMYPVLGCAEAPVEGLFYGMSEEQLAYLKADSASFVRRADQMEREALALTQPLTEELIRFRAYYVSEG